MNRMTNAIMEKNLIERKNCSSSQYEEGTIYVQKQLFYTNKIMLIQTLRV